MWYTTDVVLFDHGNDGVVAKSPVKFLCSSFNRNSSPGRKAAEDSIGNRPGGCPVDGSLKASACVRNPTKWNTNAVNKVKFLVIMKGTPDINTCMHYLCAAFSFPHSISKMSNCFQFQFLYLDRRKYGTFSLPKVCLVLCLQSQRKSSVYTSTMIRTLELGRFL